MSTFSAIASTKKLKYNFKEFNEYILPVKASEHARTKNMSKGEVIEMIQCSG